MISEIRHVGIVVNNLKKVLSFFTDVLGFKIHKKAEENRDFIDKLLKLKQAKLTTVKLKAPDGNLIELLKFHNYKNNKIWRGKIYSTGLTHISLTVRNIEKTYNILKKNKNVKFFSKPSVSPDGYAKVFFCKGPENLIIELVEIL